MLGYNKIHFLIEKIDRFFNFITPVGDLIIRGWLAYVFFKAGLTKIQSWDTTIALFQYEYSVPLLPAEIAAVIATCIELVLPVLLILGLAGRAAALILFFFNIMAVVSYPYLLTDEGVQGFYQHLYWGFMLMVIMLHGPGKLAVDALLERTKYQVKHY